MKKIIYSVFILIAVILNSCSEDSDVVFKSSDREDILRYLDNIKYRTSEDQFQKIEKLISTIDFTAIDSYKLKNEGNIKIAPLSISIDNTVETRIVFFLQRNQIVRARIIAFSAEIQSGNYNEFAFSLLNRNARSENYVGRVSFFSITQKLLLFYDLENDNVKASGVVEKKESGNNAESKLNDVCTNWFLQTTYYYSDGSSETVSQYLYTTCVGGCDPMQQCDDPNDPYYGDGGGSGVIEEVIICPQSFNYHTTASNWQAAGVSNYRFTIVDLYNNQIRSNTIMFTFEVGLPIASGLAGQISVEYAQQLAARAMNNAEQYVATHYGSDFFSAGAQSVYGHMLTEKAQQFLNEELGGTNIGKVDFGLRTLTSSQTQSARYWDSIIGGCN